MDTVVAAGMAFGIVIVTLVRIVERYIPNPHRRDDSG